MRLVHSCADARNIPSTSLRAGSSGLKVPQHDFLAGDLFRAGDIEVDVKPPEPRGVPPNSPQTGH
jgi:hypothetical protein